MKISISSSINTTDPALTRVPHVVALLSLTSLIWPERHITVLIVPKTLPFSSEKNLLKDHLVSSSLDTSNSVLALFVPYFPYTTIVAGPNDRATTLTIPYPSKRLKNLGDNFFANSSILDILSGAFKYSLHLIALLVMQRLS
ncbi:Hypothetical predicted protein [Octopus vulgaris]|uniref:Uncharacterized protein n=1 Tax=Octopus vulgaris TaxID=6645 RepID=A0AA36BZ17_OCTVU|nr:Hypothetical predicted protein [Octopus vulgaris]